MGATERLLERGAPLAELQEALRRSDAGRGELVLVVGEAGAGKTSLVRHFTDAAAECLVLFGAADPLTTPRPLGPLIDAARQIDPALGEELAVGMARVDVFALALQLVDGTLSDGRATILVLEDLHWADEATLDLLTFVARRLHQMRAMVIVSFRDDEVGADHPLRVRLGELHGAIGARIRVDPLTLDGVAALVDGTDLDSAEMYKATGGNAFFVTEALAAGGGLPTSVRDAVLARASRLTADERAVLDAASIVPGRAEVWLVEAINDRGDTRAGIDGCIARGLLHADRETDSVAFRHELARRTIEAALPSATRRRAHERALRALVDRPGPQSPARLAYHAFEAGDEAAVTQLAPVAAREAAALGAHREAAHHLENALHMGTELADPERGVLLVQLATERTLLYESERAVDAYDEAALCFERAGDVEGQADAIIRSCRPLTVLGENRVGEARVARAADLLADRPPSSSAAFVAAMESSNHMLARDFVAAEDAGQRAMALSRALGADEILAEVSVQSGIALAMSGDDEGLQRMRDGMDLARRLQLDSLVALGYSHIGSGYGELRRYDVAVPALGDGIAFASARELVSAGTYMQSWLARCELEMGHWDSAAALAGRLLRNPRCVGISRFVSLITLGWIRGRRGDPDARVLLDEALVLARQTGHLQRLWPVAACRIELAWLEGDVASEVALLDEAAALAEQLRYRPAIEELDMWRAVVDGVRRGTLADSVTPFGASAAGRPDEAAAQWRDAGCPYEEAVALLHTRRPEDMLEALRIADSLGARRLRDRAVGLMRRDGVAIPRGPTSTTRANAYGLTERELDVLAEVAGGRTNRDIAGRLGISTKTVDHHVSSVLSKLGVRSRSEAAVHAERIGLTAPAEPETSGGPPGWRG